MKIGHHPIYRQEAMSGQDEQIGGTFICLQALFIAWPCLKLRSRCCFEAAHAGRTHRNHPPSLSG